MTEEKKIQLENNTTSAALGMHFLNPQKIVEQLELLPGMDVAHFGCGAGFFTLLIAKKIGESGKVLALDILEHKLELLRAQVKSLGLKNVLEKRVNLEDKNGSRLKDASVDWVIMVNMLHQNEKRSRIIGEAKRVLKENGHILFIEWKNENNSIGPKMNVRVSREELIKLVRKNGLGISQEIDAGKFYFGMIIKK